MAVPRQNKYGTEGENQFNSDKKAFSKRQWIILLLYCFVQLLQSIVYSIQAPFYPAEAQNQGLSAAEYGIVFGVYELVTFLYVPVVYKKTKFLSLRSLLYLGVFTNGLSVLIFGFVNHLSGEYAFFACSLLLRVLEATGATTVYVVLNSSVIPEFPGSVGFVCAIMQVMIGVGLSSGPVLGSALFEVGGFSLPFFTMGVISFFTVVVCAAFLPAEEGSGITPEADRSLTILKSLRIPSNVLSYSAIFLTTISTTGLLANLEPVLRDFKLRSMTVGGVFLAYAGSFALSGPFWGFLTDRMTRIRVLTFVGSVSVAVGYCCIGPAAFIPIPLMLSLDVVGLVLCGSGYTAVCISSFTQIIRDTTEKFPDSAFIVMTASGLHLSAFALGAFLGPMIAGLLYDHFGFRNIAYLVLGLQLSLALVLLIATFVCSSNKQVLSKQLKETTRLMSKIIIEGIAGKQHFSDSGRLLFQGSYTIVPGQNHERREP